ncbi:hypothetical protein [Cytophaga aurantiaca]|uniref:hypothetical protein n=1 Tax=Cytophaga aurantiaca TaxID=29530 RepID=UPI000381BA03|nr:hypothetical protein [Cytophaga aurantiaca]
MKSLRICSWISICLSFVFKFLHYPFAGPLIVLGVFLLFIYTVIFVIKNADKNMPEVFFHLNIFIWTTYFMFRYMYWPFAQILFTVCVCLTFIYTVLLAVNKSKIRYPQTILFTYILALGILAYTQSYRIYYFFNLNPVLNEEFNTVNYQAWDKYSWFLYGANKKEKALEANKNAKNAVQKSLEINAADIYANMFNPYIIYHEDLIKKNNWTNYTEP